MQADMEATRPLSSAGHDGKQQAAAVLNDAGVYGDVESAMAKSTNTTELEIHWNHSTTINRLDPWIVDVAAAMELSDEAVDEIFDKAAEK